MAFVQGAKPVFETVRALQSGFRYFFLGILKGPLLQEENILLRNQIQSLQSHEETHRQLFEENARLRSLLGLKSSVPWEMVSVQIIGRQRDLWSRTILLDRGVEDGVRVGLPVITPAGLVGRISEVGNRAARAILLNDPHFRVSALISETRVAGLVVGTSSGDCLLTYVPLEALLRVGQKVVTAGGKSFCPSGILIGSIRTVIKDPSALFQSARLAPVVSLSALEQLLVVSNVPQEDGR